jgi:hypothetical protein
MMIFERSHSIAIFVMPFSITLKNYHNQFNFCGLQGLSLQAEALERSRSTSFREKQRVCRQNYSGMQDVHLQP